MMMSEALRQEHRGLWPHVEALKAAADGIGSSKNATDRRQVREIARFLNGSLIPHAIAEDRTLYPEVQRLLGSKTATATMSRDHAEVAALTQELTAQEEQLEGETLTEEQQRRLRRILYGLYTLLRVHFKKEEEIYLPLLDAGLTAGEGRKLIDLMGRAAAAARSHAG